MTRTIKIFSWFTILVLFICPVCLMAQTLSDVAEKPQKRLIVGVVDDPPYLIKEKDGGWTGINMDIWKHVAQELRLDYEFKEMTFKELVDALENNKIDIAIEAFFVLSERQKLFDYTIAFGVTRTGIATLPEKITHPWWAAVKIFLSWGTLKTVGLLCLILCVIGFLFWLIEKNINPDHFGGSTVRGIGSGIYWAGSTLASGVCFGITLKSIAARILGLIWMLVCAIALSALIASLASSLYENRLATGVVSEETLRHMRLGGVREGAESTVLKNLGGKYLLYQDEEGALKALLKGEIEGFFLDEITLHYYKDNDYKDKIFVYPTGARRFTFAFGLPKESPLRRKLNYAILSLMEKPDWVYLLKRYGLEHNFEESLVVKMGKRK